LARGELEVQGWTCFVPFEVYSGMTQTRPPAKLTSVEIERLAGLGTKEPEALTDKQTQKVCASVLRHIQEQKKLPKKG